MIAPIYGALPVAYDTDGIHDTVSVLDIRANTGNGFLFEYFDSDGLFWAISQAMGFFAQPEEIKAGQILRIMTQSKERFTHPVTAAQYIKLYEKMLQRPLLIRPPV